MSQAQNLYLADLREFRFLLFEQFGLGDMLGKAPFEDWGEEQVGMILEEGYRFCCDVVGPLNGSGDEQGCRIEDGQVKTPDGFKDAWKKLYEAGFKQLAGHHEFGGQGAPFAVALCFEEILAGSNTAFSMYPGLSQGVAEVVASFGTPEQKKKYVQRLSDGTWAGTMCLTEPNAGSDVGAARSRAVKNADGSYSITGTKIFISGGDSDLADNVIHLLLARVEGAAAGTKGLSLFLVPKYKIGADCSSGDSNDVSVGGIEHKMGIKGSSTAVLNFGEGGTCTAELVGTVEHQGMAQMFKMMNGARILVGVQGIAVASSAYLNALKYARTRQQGASIKQWKDASAPRVAIIEHADVRRMLLDMKSRVEGIRCLALQLAVHSDRARMLQGKNDGEAAFHQGMVDLLVPLVKAYGSDQAYQICTTAIQTLGGYGYLKDYGIEQYCRDSKIFSIYEGTNHIQAMDLVGRKLSQNGGANFMRFGQEIGGFVAGAKGHAVLGSSAEALGKAQEALMGTAMRLMGWFQGGRVEMVPLNANRFLEMMSETTVGWLLLVGAKIAADKLATTPETHADHAFYRGKIEAAKYFAKNVLPGVAYKADLIANEDDSALKIPDAGFATI